MNNLAWVAGCMFAALTGIISTTCGIEVAISGALMTIGIFIKGHGEYVKNNEK